MNTATIISFTICGTIIILFLIACVYDYKVKTADMRALKRFEKAFGNTKTVYIPNHEKTEPAPAADSGEPLDFPNSNNDSLSKYH